MPFDADGRRVSRLPVNVPYHVAVRRSRLVRNVYYRCLSRVVGRPIRSPRMLDFEVYSFSGELDLPEQVASIRSFLQRAGEPTSFTVVSDGSHTAKHSDLLQRVHPSIRVRPVSRVARADLPPEVTAYAAKHPLGKKLSMLLSLDITRPTIYVDSDILFFEAAADLADARYRASGSLYYLPDCRPSLDDTLVEGTDGTTPVNSGFLILNRTPDWTNALNSLTRSGSEGGFFTEQTVVHLAVHENGGVELDSAKYVVGVRDQFRFRDDYTWTSPALRHYTRPVRYRFWSNLRAAGAL